jgi:hypothetical protein
VLQPQALLAPRASPPLPEVVAGAALDAKREKGKRRQCGVVRDREGTNRARRRTSWIKCLKKEGLTNSSGTQAL